MGHILDDKRKIESGLWCLYYYHIDEVDYYGLDGRSLLGHRCSEIQKGARWSYTLQNIVCIGCKEKIPSDLLVVCQLLGWLESVGRKI